MWKESESDNEEREHDNIFPLKSREKTQKIASDIPFNRTQACWHHYTTEQS